MSTAIEIFSSAWIQALGWALLHSIWQSLLCLIVVIALLRVIPSTFSGYRYTVATVGLLVSFVASVGTFLYLNSTGADVYSSADIVLKQPVHDSVTPATPVLEYAHILQNGTAWIQSYIPLIVSLWALGAILFSLRVFGGWWYVTKLRGQSFPIAGEFSETLQALAAKLNINRFVALAESSVIQAPVVIGYLKPVILIPVGMCAGLSTDQLESILIHELVHIRRGDYFMNLVQSLLEAMFFFNPFVWIISGMIRREREHCCDDAVVSVHGNALAYARALTTLEESRLSRSGLALSLAENKNQLLNRIKRIMEKSVHHYSGRERIVPLVLLIVGLICASWLTIQSGSRDTLKELENSEPLAASDTTIKNNTSSSYYRREIKTLNEDGQPDVRVVEEVDGDIDPVTFSAMPFDISIPPIPDVPDFDVIIPPIPDIDVAMPEMPELEIFSMDTFPNGTMHWNNSHEQEEFSKAFEKSFKSQFKDFYKAHEKELKKMMADVEEQVNANAGHDLTEQMERLAYKQEKLARIQFEELHGKEKDLAERTELQAIKAEQFAKRWEEANANRMEKVQKDMKVIEEKMKAMERRHKEMEGVMEDELIKDGYLKTGEKLNNLDISNEGIEVNGKKIKSSDEKKYRKLVVQFGFEVFDDADRKE